MKTTNSAMLRLVASMIIFGTIGGFVSHIPLPSSWIALARAVIGMAFLGTVMLLRKRHMDWHAVRSNLHWLLLSGGCLGFNWIFLFESYSHTNNVAISTLCYYMAPIFIILVSPLLLKERLTVKKSLCAAAALIGMVCISDLFDTSVSSRTTGILFGLSAAVLYAAVVLLNKQLKSIDALSRTVLQLGISAVILLPYCFATYETDSIAPNGYALLMLLVIGIVHTGIPYYWYFGALAHVSAQSAAVISYTDPMIAVLVSVLYLKQDYSLMTIVGTVLILGAALYSELPAGMIKRRNCNEEN